MRLLQLFLVWYLTYILLPPHVAGDPSGWVRHADTTTIWLLQADTGGRSRTAPSYSTFTGNTSPHHLITTNHSAFFYDILWISYIHCIQSQHTLLEMKQSINMPFSSYKKVRYSAGCSSMTIKNLQRSSLAV